MKFTILTIFPDSFSYLNQSILKKAQERRLIEIEIVDIRNFSKDKHKKVDDIPFWWWQWMVMTCQPIFDAIENVKNKSSYKNNLVIFMSPWWKELNQEKVIKYSLLKDYEFIIICWRYEWIDQRIIESLVDQEISIWNYILSWWELPAMIFIDSISRLISWVIWNKKSYQEESFSEKFWGKKEFPHYTRPKNFCNLKVPDVLISWNHD